MTSIMTLNRIKKVTLLKQSLNGILDLLMMQHRARGLINMAEYKELLSKVEEMLEVAKLAGKKYT